MSLRRGFQCKVSLGRMQDLHNLALAQKDRASHQITALQVQIMNSRLISRDKSVLIEFTHLAHKGREGAFPHHEGFRKKMIGSSWAVQLIEL